MVAKNVGVVLANVSREAHSRAPDLSVGGSSPDMHQTCVRKYVLRDSTSPGGAASPKKQRFTPVLIAIY